MASTSGVGGGGRDAPPSTPLTGTTRGRDQLDTTPGASPDQARPRVGGSPGGGVGAAASTSRASGPPLPPPFNLPAAAVAGGAAQPAPGAADAETNRFKVYENAKTTCTELKKHDLCGDAVADEAKRKAIIDGLVNIRVYVVMLDDVAEVVLDIGGDLTEESETRPTLENVRVIPADRAPGPRPDDVVKRPKNDDGFGPASVTSKKATVRYEVKLKYEDGQQDFDAPVTEDEIVENERRLLRFLTASSVADGNGDDVVTKGERGGEVSLPLNRERELVAKNGDKLVPRMLHLTLSGALSRQLDMIEEVPVVEGDSAAAKKQQQAALRSQTQANADVRARLRACTQETKALPLEINLLATPGAEVKTYADGTVEMVLPAITRWPIDTKTDNLAGKKGDYEKRYGAFLYPMRTPAERVNRNTNNLAGGIGASGGEGESRVSSANAERRLSMNRCLFDQQLDLHQTCGASLLEDFLNFNEPPRAEAWWRDADVEKKMKRRALEATAVKMNALVEIDDQGRVKIDKQGRVKSARRQPPHYEVFAGKLRLQPPHCVLDVVIRIFGDKGLIEQGRPAAGSDELRERLWIKFFGEDEKPDGEKCKVLAAKLLLHALRYADYENIRKDPTRRVLPIFTDHSLVNFWGYAFGGIAILMEKVNAARPDTFAAERVELAKRSVEVQKILDEEVAKNVMRGMAGVSVKVLSRMLTCLSPYKDTNKERGSLTKIAGAEVTHGMRVRESLRRSLRRVTGGYVADLSRYREASEAACKSLVRSAEHILRLPGERGVVLKEKKSLLRGGFSEILNTKGSDATVDSASFVHFVYFRVSSEDTVESETRFGFGVQFDMWKAQFPADEENGLGFPSSAHAAGAHHVVWIVSVQSRIAANPLDAPVAIFEEDPESNLRLPDLKTLKTATAGTAIGVALAAEGKNREGRLVTMSAMYADRVTLKDFTDAAPAGVRVVGFDALDLRPLIELFPEIALGQEGWKRRMIHVERGYGGNALVAHRLGCALAAPSDLNVLRNAGFEAANQDSGAPEAEKTRDNMERVAKNTARPLKVFENVIVPRWFEAVKPDVNGQTPMPPGPDTFGSKKNMTPFDTEKFTSALRLSGPEQIWRGQLQLLSWVGGRGQTKVYLRPFSATIDLTKATDAEVSGNIWVTDRLWADDGSSPAPEPGKRGKKSDILDANFFPSMSRAANPGVLEHAHENKTWFCLVDVAIAVKLGYLDDVWVRADEDPPSDGCEFARRTNLRNPFVYALLRAIRDGGHLPHRYLLRELTTLGLAGAKADADAVASASAGA